MAKGVGLDAGEFEVKVVELDGSFRKPKLGKVSLDTVSQLTSSAADPEHAMAEATALLHAVKGAGVAKQNVCLGFSSREATFRQLIVPFTGTDRIRKVIKFEAEGEIHSQSVDEMVIDFHVVEEVREETRVLVAGVPKAPLRTTLDALVKVGIEPEHVDLDTMALYRIADWSGALAPDSDDLVASSQDADGEGASTVARGDELTSRLVLDIGARGVRVLAVAEGHLVDMRAVPFGTDTIAEEIAERFGLNIDEARDAMIHCLATGEDYAVASEEQFVVEEDDSDGGDSEESDDSNGDEDGDSAASDANLPARADSVPCDAVVQARERYFMRVRREFMRFLVAVKGLGRIEAAFTTGAGSLLPGTNELLADVLGCQPQPLLYFDLLSHQMDEDEVAYMEPRLAVAIGLALGRLGGIEGFNFRQEDLSFTRGFDRVKLPLAIACMLSLFYLFFIGVGLRKDLKNKERSYGFMVDKQAKGGGGRQTGKLQKTYKQFKFGYLRHLVNDGRWPEQNLKRGPYRKMMNDLAAVPTFNRLNWYYSFLKRQLTREQKRGEYSPELTLDSGLAVLQQFSGVIEEASSGMGRFYVCDLDLRIPAGKRQGRRLEFKLFIRGENFRDRIEHFEAQMKKVCADKDSAFEKLDPRREDVVTGVETGAYYRYKVSLKAKIPVQDV